MAKKVIKPDDNFYQDLDSEIVGRSPLTCSHLIIILLVLAMALYWVGWRITKTFHWSFLLRQKEALVEIGQRVTRQINAEINQSSNQLSIVLNDNDLEHITQGVEVIDDSIIRKVKAGITEDGVMVSGVIVNPVALPFQIWYYPEIEKGTLFWRMTKFSLFKISMPKIAAKGVDQAFQSVWRQFSQTIGSVKLEKVALAPGKMQLTGTKK